MSAFFIFAGETSGDLHGSHLMKALRQLLPHSTFKGVGGPLMRTEGLDTLLEMEQFRVMGFSDVFKAFPKLYRQFYLVRDAILTDQPNCVILIDYPGFNLRLAKALRKKGYQGKLVHYICPTVWAHGKDRIQTMAATLDLLLTIFPFEAAYFAHTSLKVTYVGNPLATDIKNYAYQDTWMEILRLPNKENLVALFPGSRLGEIQRMTPHILEVASRLKTLHPELIFALSYADEELHAKLIELITASPLRLNQEIFLVPLRYRYELMRDCQIALVKSGTVTLELALHQKPTVVVYALSKLNYYIAKYILRLNLPFYSMPNIILNKEVFPEYIGEKLDQALITSNLDVLLTDSSKRKAMRRDCQTLIKTLGEMKTHESAALAIRGVLC